MTEHWHTDQKHIEKTWNEATGEIEIKSYCLKCGELVFKTTLKEQNKS